MLRRRSAILAMLATALLFSTGGAAVKLSQLNAWQIAGARSAIAALCLLLWLPEARRRWRPQTFLVGASYAATLVLFVHANKLTTAASTIFLQATSPLYLIVLGPLILRESLSRREKVLAPVLAFYLLMDLPKLAEKARALFPDANRDEALHVARQGSRRHRFASMLVIICVNAS